MRELNLQEIGEEIGIQHNFFFGRQMGERAYVKLRKALENILEGEALYLTFYVDAQTNSSFVDEMIVRIANEIIAGDFGERAIILKDPSDDVLEEIEAAIARGKHKVALVWVCTEGEWGYIGSLEGKLEEILELFRVQKEITAPELVQRFELGIHNASMRLLKLYNTHLVRRKHDPELRGYIYSLYHEKEDLYASK